MIKALIIRPGEAPETAEIDDSLYGLQTLVEGYIECYYPFRDSVVLIVNEEGKLIGLPQNRRVFDERGQILDIICGTFLVVGLNRRDDFSDLTETQIARYSDYFKETI